MKQVFAEHLTFFRQFRETFVTTGAVAPSSRFLAKAMTRPLAERRGPVRVLEVGPGTGAVTNQIVRLLKEGDRFDLVELNPRFVDVLNGRFDGHPDYRKLAHCSAVHHLPLQEFRSPEPYDYIISGLPLNNFPVPLVEEIFGSFFSLLRPGGVLSYFEYMYVRPMRRLVAKNEEKVRLAGLEDVIRRYLGPHRFRQDWVFVNVPPAWVQHLRT
jgi:phosphatidylethanolamine/phosphatidyl-N-methylethanolamine N-methyltransferase